jgi:hypothetical protein
LRIWTKRQEEKEALEGENQEEEVRAPVRANRGQDLILAAAALVVVLVVVVLVVVVVAVAVAAVAVAVAAAAVAVPPVEVPRGRFVLPVPLAVPLAVLLGNVYHFNNKCMVVYISAHSFNHSRWHCKHLGFCQYPGLRLPNRCKHATCMTQPHRKVCHNAVGQGSAAPFSATSSRADPRQTMHSVSGGSVDGALGAANHQQHTRRAAPTVPRLQ